MMLDAWTIVGSIDDFAENSVTEVMIEGRSVAIYRLDGEEFYPTDNICTHQYARLCEGWLDGYLIECPLHAGSFNIRDGKVAALPSSRICPLFQSKSKVETCWWISTGNAGADISLFR